MEPHIESWDFRIRGTFGITTRIDADLYELVLSDKPPVRVTLHASGREVALKDTEIFIVWGTGYTSADQARQQGEAWWDYVMVGFARQRIGADFGVRTPLQGGMTESGFGIMRAAMEPERHRPVQLFNERSGVQVYATEPPAYFWHGHASGLARRASEGVLDAIQAAHAADARMPGSDRLAYDLYAASFSDIPGRCPVPHVVDGAGNHDHAGTTITSCQVRARQTHRDRATLPA
jgi:hypothetical protein